MTSFNWKLAGGVKGMCYMLAQNWRVTLCIVLVGCIIYMLTG